MIRRSNTPRQLTGAARVAQMIGRLRVAEGPLRGQRFALRDWQKQFLAGVYAKDTRIALLSMGRGGGKTAFIGALAAVELARPDAVERTDIVSVSHTFAGAKRLGRFVLDYLAPLIEADRSNWRITDSANSFSIFNRRRAIRYRAVSPRPESLHGEGCRWWLVDEPAQLKQTEADRVFSAITTASGKVEAARMIALSTFPSSPTHWMARLVSEGAPDCYAQVHKAADDKLTWKNCLRANPGMTDTLRREVKADLARARKDDIFARSFRALRLNLGISERLREPLIDAADWGAIEEDGLAIGSPFALGIDLGGSAAWSAAAACDGEGHVDGFAVVGGIPGIEDRERNDRVQTGLYEAMRKEGDLRVSDGQRVPPPADVVGAALERWGRPQVVVADRYRQGELMDALRTHGLDGVQMVWRGMGQLHGAEDALQFRREVLNRNVRARRSLTLRGSLAAAEVRINVMGKPVLVKAPPDGARPGGRNDLACAVMLAVAEAGRRREAEDAAADAPAIHFTLDELGMAL